MCGIFGIWQLDHQPVDLHKLQQATTAIRHRGPDDEGYLLVNSQTGVLATCGGLDTNVGVHAPRLGDFTNQAFDLTFGFRRLAILDLSPAGHQPMVSAEARYWIVFNGEVYNYLELREELAAYGHTFQSGSDTEVILAAYRQWGINCLPRFNGMWALAIWDQVEQSLFVARDRFGVKPLYYTLTEGRFSFGSEIKTLVGMHGIPFQPSSKLIYRYILAGVLPNPQQAETFFDGVFSLPPGHHLLVKRDGVKVQRYWELSYSEPTATKNIVTLVDEYRAQFTDAVRLRLRADVPVGTCLSGGVDSSSIVCTINQMLHTSNDRTAQAAFRAGQQQTFSAVYETPGRHNERAYIDQVLGSVQQVAAHFTFPTVERLSAELAQFVWHQDEPCLSPSPFAQWCVMQKAREQGVTVLLDGQGADEALAGYRPYGVHLQNLLRSGKLGDLRSEMAAIQQVTGLDARTLLQQTVLATLPDAGFMELRKLWWQLRSAHKIFRPEVARQWGSTLGDGYPYEHAANLNQHLQFKVMVTLPELLRYEDRNSMAHSIEARVPFLDYRLMQFTFNQVPHLRIHDGWTKWILRKAMAGLVPDAIIWRRDKVGFETPQKDWLTALVQQDPSWFSDQACSAEYLNMAVVRQQLPAMLNERKPNRSLLWRLMNLEVWLRVWQEGKM